MISKNVKISIIIPVYKTEQYLSKCIQSCQNQTYQNIEIILIDDGSPDNCGKICDSYAEQDKRIVVIHQKNSGVSVSRNNGIKKCSGEFITFVDSDDWIEPDTIEKLLLEQQANNFDLVICGHYKHIDKSVKKEALITKVACNSKEDIVNILLQRKKINLFRTPCSKLFLKKIICTNKIIFDQNLTLGEDYKFVLDYLKNINTCVIIPEALNHFLINMTLEKKERYAFQDAEYQWNLGIEEYKTYKNYFLYTNLYKKNRIKIETYFLNIIKTYLYKGFTSNYSRKIVAQKLHSITNMENYETLKKIPLRLVDDPIEKIVLIAVKLKAWNTLYYIYFLKFKLYNERQNSKVMQ